MDNSTATILTLTVGPHVDSNVDKFYSTQPHSCDTTLDFKLTDPITSLQPTSQSREMIFGDPTSLKVALNTFVKSLLFLVVP